jgi:hypothetical protein
MTYYLSQARHAALLLAKSRIERKMKCIAQNVEQKIQITPNCAVPAVGF